MIYVIVTSSILNKHGVIDYEHRKNTYITCIKALLSLVKDDPLIKPIVVENNGIRETYLDELECDVVYTFNNELVFPHKGNNELLDIKHVISEYKINDDDFIIKLTGRYKILDSSFINLVKEKCDNYDAFLKFFNVCSGEFDMYDCVLGLFAIRCKHLLSFEYKYVISAECEFATHVRKVVKDDRIRELDDLQLECCFADNLRLLRV